MPRPDAISGRTLFAPGRPMLRMVCGKCGCVKVLNMESPDENTIGCTVCGNRMDLQIRALLKADLDDEVKAELEELLLFDLV